MTTIVTIVGARPQFVKAAVVSRVLRALPGVREVLVHTGQHYDDNMSAVFFRELGIPAPDHQLGIGSYGHGAQTGRMLEAVEGVLRERTPDTVLVYGDTNSTLAGALAAAKLRIPVAHVEAGLRSYNRAMPEEINRVLADHLSDVLFAPCDAAVANLEREGIGGARVHQFGDVMFDLALSSAARAETRSRILQQVGVEPGGYVLATVHRAENTDDPQRLAAILQGLALVARDVPVVLPVHPRLRAVMQRCGSQAASSDRMLLIDPVGYLDMTMLEKHACLIATDSGGVQKEAFFHRVPCVTLRDETEWGELVEAGWNRLVPPANADTIAGEILSRIGALGTRTDLYGDGRAAQRIAARLAGKVALAAGEKSA